MLAQEIARNGKLTDTSPHVSCTMMKRAASYRDSPRVAENATPARNHSTRLMMAML